METVTTGSTSHREFREVAIHLLKPSSDQPRKYFDESLLEEMRLSIGRHGILEPLILRSEGDHFVIVCGERRFRAARDLGLRTVPAVLLEVDSQNAFVVALHENLQRANLTPIEEARAFRQMLERGIVTSQAGIGRILGISRARVSQKLGLLELPLDLQEQFSNASGKGTGGCGLTERHARAIRRLPNEDDRRTVVHRAIRESLTVAATEAMVAKMLDTGPCSASMRSAWVTLGRAKFRTGPNGFELRVSSTARTEIRRALKAALAAQEANPKASVS